MFLSALRHLRWKVQSWEATAIPFMIMQIRIPWSYLTVYNWSQWMEMNELIIAKPFVYLHMCLRAGCREADRGRENKRAALCFVYLEEKPKLTAKSAWQCKSPARQLRLRCYHSFYDTAFQSFCQGFGDKDLMLLTIFLSRVVKEKSLHWCIQYGALHTRKRA